jgi:hypothetical protein
MKKIGIIGGYFLKSNWELLKIRPGKNYCP